MTPHDRQTDTAHIGNSSLHLLHSMLPKNEEMRITGGPLVYCTPVHGALHWPLYTPVMYRWCSGRMSNLVSKGPRFDPGWCQKVNACLLIFNTIKLCLVLYYVFDCCFGLYGIE